MLFPRNKRGQISPVPSGGYPTPSSAPAVDSGRALFFCAFAAIITIIIWFYFTGIDTLMHAVVQIVLLIAAGLIMGNRNPEMCERIAGIFSLQISFIMFLASLNSGFSGFNGFTSQWTWMFFPLISAAFILMVFSGQGISFVGDALKKMLTPILIFAILAALIGQFWLSGTEFFASIAPIFQGIHNIFIFVFSSLWVWWSLSYASQGSKLARWIMLISVLFFLVIAIHSLYLSGVFSGGDDQVGVDYRSLSANMWTQFKEGRQRGLDAIRTGAANARNFTQNTLNPTFETKVESQQGRDVGVFFERQPGVKTSYRSNEDIFVRSLLRATTIDNPITMRFSCNFEHVGAEGNVTGRVSRDTVFVRSSIEQPFNCELDPSDAIDGVWPVGANKVNLLASFDFATSSYTKRYAMDIQRAEALQQQGVDPLDQYSITDKKPASIFTPGPVKLAVGSVDFTILTHANTKNRTDLNIEITKNFGWDGDLDAVNQLAVFLPDGIEMIRDTTEEGNPYRCAGNFRFEPVDEVSLCQNPEFFNEGGCASFNIYTLDLEHLEDEHDGLDISRPWVTSCPLEVSSSRTILGNAPIGILSFRAYMDYNFSLSDRIPISIRRTEVDQSSSTEQVKNFGSLGRGSDTLAIDNQIVDFAKSSLDSGERSQLDELFTGTIGSLSVKSEYRSLLYGIMKANGYDAQTEGRCIGVGGNCGVMQINAIQYAQVRDTHSLTLPPFDEYGDQLVRDNKLNAVLTSAYLDILRQEHCRGQGPGVPECLVGKYYAGTGFKYPEYPSCGTLTNVCYYAIDTFIPTALSYASAYEQVIAP